MKIKMWTIVLKLFWWLCIANINSILAYQSDGYNSKTAYIQQQLKQKVNTKDYNSNRYGAHAPTRITYRPPWLRTEAYYKQQITTDRPMLYDSNVRFRHASSRHPNLDNVLTKLHNMRTTTTSTTLRPSYQRNGYFGQTNAEISDNAFNNYSDEEDDDMDYNDTDDLPDYDKWDIDDDLSNDTDQLDDDDDNFLFEEEDEDDDDTEEEYEDGWQAEEATETAPSSLTEYKWQHYGTRGRVEESRRNQQFPEHSSSYAEINAAIQHALRINREGRCRSPSPRVLSVQIEHPDPGKTYIPHCTVLHRCAEDTGCCPNHMTRCAPKKQTLVYLYFYPWILNHVVVKPANLYQPPYKRYAKCDTTSIGVPGNKVERLAFYNHTECACLDRSISPDSAETSIEETSLEVTRPYRSTLSIRAAPDSSFLSAPSSIQRCKCPEEYSSRARFSRCTCDCDHGNIDCENMKKGGEFFSLKDRLCIRNGECGLPNCEYGPYLRPIGRCPRKQEKVDAFANMET